AGLAALEREVSELQRPMVERLRELGAGATIRQHILANAVSAELTPTGIAEMAKRPDVRLIRLEREDQVTTGGSISPQPRRSTQLPTALVGRSAGPCARSAYVPRSLPLRSSRWSRVAALHRPPRALHKHRSPRVHRRARRSRAAPAITPMAPSRRWPPPRPPMPGPSVISV